MNKYLTLMPLDLTVNPRKVAWQAKLKKSQAQMTFIIIFFA